MRTLSAMLLAAMCPSMVAGHGYVSAPWGRPYGCKLGHNTGCGNVQYEPQSVEGPDRYPETGVADGQIAAAGNPVWAQLSQTGADRWAKHSLATGWNTFEWTFTATHSTRDFRYWITKEGWNPEEPLSRAQFEDGPFCTVNLNGAQGATNRQHECFVPQRTGYHVILSVWDVLDTPLGFYNVIDATFGSGTPTPTAATATPPVTATPPATPTPPATQPPAGNPWHPNWATSTCSNDGTHVSPRDDWGLKATKQECCEAHFDWRLSLCLQA